MVKPLQDSEWDALRELILDTPWTEAVRFVWAEAGMSLVRSIRYTFDVAWSYPNNRLLTTCPLERTDDLVYEIEKEILRLLGPNYKFCDTVGEIGGQYLIADCITEGS